MNSNQHAHREFSVLCVDDNPRMAVALRTKIERVDGFNWFGWLSSADGLLDRVLQEPPDFVLLDLDMPGLDPFSALESINDQAPDTKVVVFSGHVRKELIDRAIETGAWGYVSKNDGEDALIQVLRSILAGEFGMSAEVRSTWTT